MVKKKLGVLGGMGPMATSVFFDRMIKNTQATCDQEHIDTVILNHTSIPDRTTCIIHEEYDHFFEEIAKSLAIFDQLGVSHIAIPCNTSHYFYEDLCKMTSVPIINMVDETALALAEILPGQARVGVLGTDGTLMTDIYKKALEGQGMTCVYPDDKTQKKVMDAIYNIKGSDLTSLSEVDDIIDHMVHDLGCHRVILACTELSILDIQGDKKAYCIDAMDVLVRESIRLADKKWVTSLLAEAVTSVS